MKNKALIISILVLLVGLSLRAGWELGRWDLNERYKNTAKYVLEYTYWSNDVRIPSDADEYPNELTAGRVLTPEGDRALVNMIHGYYGE